MDKDKDMSRRRFLKMAALTGAAMCVGPTLNKVTAAERAWTAAFYVHSCEATGCRKRPREMPECALVRRCGVPECTGHIRDHCR